MSSDFNDVIIYKQLQLQSTHELLFCYFIYWLI